MSWLHVLPHLKQNLLLLNVVIHFELANSEFFIAEEKTAQFLGELIDARMRSLLIVSKCDFKLIVGRPKQFLDLLEELADFQGFFLLSLLLILEFKLFFDRQQRRVLTRVFAQTLVCSEGHGTVGLLAQALGSLRFELFPLALPKHLSVQRVELLVGLDVLPVFHFLLGKLSQRRLGSSY